MIIYNGQDISDFVTSQQRSSDINQAPERLDVSAAGIKFKAGDHVIDIQDGSSVFSGYIFECGKSRSSGNRFTAYSVKKYLIKNDEAGDFSDITANTLLKKLCTDAGIPLGVIEETKVVIPRLIFENEMLIYDMILIALNETVKRGGDKYIITDKSGCIELKRRKDNIVKFMFEEQNNIIDAESSESIEDMYNVIKVYGSDKKVLDTVRVQNDIMISKYGRMQKVEMPSVQTKAEMQSIADSLLSELAKVTTGGSITVLDIPGVDAGMAIVVYDSATDLIGTYYVEAVTHDEKEKTMNIVLTESPDIAAVEYTLPKESVEKNKNSNSKEKKKDAEKDTKADMKVKKETWEEILGTRVLDK